MPARRNRKSARPKPPQKAWAGRFTEKPDPRAEAYTSSLDVDLRLLPADIAGSLAHVEMLAKRKILAAPEARKIQAGLRTVLREWEQGKLQHRPSDEDVHMLVERRLHELIGPVAGKVHTARSRNDQVATDFKLYLRAEVEHLAGALRLLLLLSPVLVPSFSCLLLYLIRIHPRRKPVQNTLHPTPAHPQANISGAVHTAPSIKPECLKVFSYFRLS